MKRVALLAFMLGRSTAPKSTPDKSHATETAMAHKAKKQLYTCGMHPQVIQDHPGNCPICAMALTPVKNTDSKVTEKDKNTERKVLYWRAPMDPTYISKKPGKSPMGMNLVPVYNDEVSSGEITISPAVEQNIGITTATVRSGPLSLAIKTYGSTTWDEKTLSAINTKIDGWIEKLYVNETGQRVRKGQPLLSIYSPQLVATQREYLAALDTARALQKSSDATVAQGGKDLLVAARHRLTLWDISGKQIDRLERTRNVRKNLTLYSPISGIVTHRAVVVGDHVKAGMNLLKIAALDPICQENHSRDEWITHTLMWKVLPVQARFALSFPTGTGKSCLKCMPLWLCLFNFLRKRSRSRPMRSSGLPQTILWYSLPVARESMREEKWSLDRLAMAIL